LTIVWNGLTQEELDAQYDQRTVVPDPDAYIRRWSEWSALLRKERPPKEIRYGPAECETFDLFDGSGDVLHVHLHGGAWRALTKRDASFAVRGLAAEGAGVAVLDFGLAPATTLSAIVDQVRRALCFIHKAFPRRRLIISGHSSGAHLASCLLDREWLSGAGVAEESIAGFLLVSGPYDLRPVQLSSRNAYLTLTAADAERLTAMRRLPERLPPIRVFWGELELDEFRRQGRDFLSIAQRPPADAASGEVRGANHFDLYDAFHETGSLVGRAAHALQSGA
jgi:arylformamidase